MELRTIAKKRLSESGDAIAKMRALGLDHEAMVLADLVLCSHVMLSALTPAGAQDPKIELTREQFDQILATRRV